MNQEINQQQYSQQNHQISSNDNSVSTNKIELIISITNFVFCLVLICIVTINFFSQLVNSETGSSSGWFLFVMPIIISIYFLACVPDALCLLFSSLNNSKKKIIFPILVIIFSIIGCIIMNSNLITELLTGLNILQLIYTIFKITLIIFNIITIILYKKQVKQYGIK